MKELTEEESKQLLELKKQQEKWLLEMAKRQNAKVQLEELDEILRSFEDWMHGDDGKEITKARGIVQNIALLMERSIDRIYY